MCGRGVVLVEAARQWPAASYVGVELDADALAGARDNLRSVRNPPHTGAPLYPRAFGNMCDGPLLLRCHTQDAVCSMSSGWCTSAGGGCCRRWGRVAQWGRATSCPAAGCSEHCALKPSALSRARCSP